MMKAQAIDWEKSTWKPHTWQGTNVHIMNSQNSIVKIQKNQLEKGAKDVNRHSSERKGK